MSADDIIAIQQLLARSNVAVDSGDGAAYAACYTENGRLDAGAGGVFVGRDAIAAAGDSFATNMPGLRHLSSNHAIDVMGDTATATVYLIVVTAGATPTVAATGVYQDHLEHTADGWLFASRSPKMDTESGPLSLPG